MNRSNKKKHLQVGVIEDHLLLWNVARNGMHMHLKFVDLDKLRLKGITSHWWLLQMRGNPLWACWNCLLLWHYLQWWIWPMTRAIFVGWVRHIFYLVHNRGYMRVMGLPTHPTLVSSVWYQCRCWFTQRPWRLNVWPPVVHLPFSLTGSRSENETRGFNLWHATYHIVSLTANLCTPAMA
jgi:hypothetical protein